jgi:type VI secretion system secreted protein VgrG
MPSLPVQLPGGALSLALGSDISLDVRRFRVTERISSFYSVEVEAVSPESALDFELLIGQPARFSLGRGIEERVWSGIVREIHQVETEEDGLSTYALFIVPRLWLLTQRSNHRIFQNLTEIDIVKSLLDEWHIPHASRLSETYKRREIRVQYAESDFHFLSRLLEDAGISFWFEIHDGATTVIFSDSPQRGEPRTARLPFKADVTMVTGEYATHLRAAREVRPGRYSVRDRDYRLPAAYPLLASTSAPGLDQEAALETFHNSPGAFLFESAKGEATPSADDRGKFRSDEAEGARLAKRRLDALRGEAYGMRFETNAHDITPGVVVHIDGHARPEPSRGLLVVGSKLEGQNDGEWLHVCEARSIERHHRPSLRAPRPRTQGLESATVVGPKGEEIHTDEMGRVRVHFHWDRESGLDEKS